MIDPTPALRELAERSEVADRRMRRRVTIASVITALLVVGVGALGLDNREQTERIGRTERMLCDRQEVILERLIDTKTRFIGHDRTVLLTLPSRMPKGGGVPRQKLIQEIASLERGRAALQREKDLLNCAKVDPRG